MLSSGRQRPIRLSSAFAIFILAGAVVAASAQEFEAGLNHPVDSCRMDACNGFSIKFAWPIATASNGTLFDVTITTTYTEYAPSEQHPYKKVLRSESGVGNLFVFCSKQRPALFTYSDEKHQWHLRVLFPGDPLDVDGASDTDTLMYLATCHHYFPQDGTTPAAIATIRRLGYAFSEGDAQKFTLPTVMDNMSPFEFVAHLADRYEGLPDSRKAVSKAKTP